MGNTVCVSVAALFYKYGRNLPSGNTVKVSFSQLGKYCPDKMKRYFDLYDKHGGIVCMDGEECQVWYSGSGYYEFFNQNGYMPATFRLTTEEYEVAKVEG